MSESGLLATLQLIIIISIIICIASLLVPLLPQAALQPTDAPATRAVVVAVVVVVVVRGCWCYVLSAAAGAATRALVVTVGCCCCHLWCRCHGQESDTRHVCASEAV